jgi:hypothetical protein
MRDVVIRTVPRHCENPECRKCGARFRWYRRKAWHISKPADRKSTQRKAGKR